MTKNLVIKLLEYERLFQVIHSVSEKIDDRAGASCLFYNTIGAFLIESILKIPARPVMGSAFVLVDDPSDTVLSFSNVNEDGTFSSNNDAFHCWVETQEHVIDFTAPVYQKYFDKMGKTMTVPGKMFQKRKIDMSPSYQGFSKEGDYFMEGNESLTRDLLSRQSPTISDLANICLLWYKSPPKKIDKSMTIQNDLGEIININLTSMRVYGAW